MTTPPPTQTQVSTLVEKRLRAAGIPGSAIAAVREIDALMQDWRRRLRKRELGLSAIRDLGLDFDLAHLDTLSAIAAPAREFDAETGEIMVGTIAERLMIDPSRASRLVSDVVTAGYVRRSASQKDSRRTVLDLTDSGVAVIEAVRTYKFLLMGEMLSSWSEDETRMFLQSLARFNAWSERDDDVKMTRFAGDIAALRNELAATQTHEPA